MVMAYAGGYPNSIRGPEVVNRLEGSQSDGRPGMQTWRGRPGGVGLSGSICYDTILYYNSIYQ